MMKAEKVVLGDSEDMEGLLEKQKVFFTFFSFCCSLFVLYLRHFVCNAILTVQLN